MTEPRSGELREKMTVTMAAHGVPQDRAAAKVSRTVEGLKLIQAGERNARYIVLLSMLMVTLLVMLDKLTSLWLLAFFAVPMLWGLGQAARGAVMLSSDVLRHMGKTELDQLGWFTRWAVTLVKTWKAGAS